MRFPKESSSGWAESADILPPSNNLRDTGYEDVRTEMDIRVYPMPQPYQGERLRNLLVDFSIGALASRCFQGDIWDVRFGIRAPSATHSFRRGGKLEVHTKLPKEGLLLYARQEIHENASPRSRLRAAGLGALVNEDTQVRLVLPNSVL